jgi:hypothetical protein
MWRRDVVPGRDVGSGLPLLQARGLVAGRGQTLSTRACGYRPRRSSSQRRGLHVQHRSRLQHTSRKQKKPFPQVMTTLMEQGPPKPEVQLPAWYSPA